MVFKEPLNRAEATSRAQQRDALLRASHVLDDCKVEPDISAKLKQLAGQLDTALRAYEES